MLKLPDVTMVAVDCTNRINGTVNALVESSKDIDFGAIKLLSHEKPQNLPEFIQFAECPKINNINDYNHFMFLELGKHIKTSHCLTVQDHAKILDSNLWNDDWLQYSYIGAPWAIVPNTYIANDGTRSRVGNGGFSLRDRLVLDIPNKNNWHLREEQGWKNEDGQLCAYWKKELLALGVNYAPIEVAVHFAFETPMLENYNIKPFGYHRHLPSWGKYE